MKYYFTYGSGDTQPFTGGWTVVYAKDGYEAIAKFNEVHPKTADGCVDCAFIYGEEYFMTTPMYKKGNFGKFEQEVIK